MNRDDAAPTDDCATPRDDPRDDGPPAHVIWHSSLLDLSGYAAVGRSIVTALDLAGVKVRAKPIWGSLDERR